MTSNIKNFVRAMIVDDEVILRDILFKYMEKINVKVVDQASNG